jgi:DNA-binding MarR family transcriptional regulator
MATGKKRQASRQEPETPQSWTFLTNHAHVLLSLAGDANLRIRDLAARVGITERAVQRIISELEEAGFLTHERQGRRNVYRVRASRPFRHPLEAHQNVAVLLQVLLRSKG